MASQVILDKETIEEDVSILPHSEPILPDRLKYLRKNYQASGTSKLGLTQAELAGKLGISVVAVKKYESGDSIPTSEILSRMCELYGVILYFSPEKIHPLLQRRRGDILNQPTGDQTGD